MSYHSVYNQTIRVQKKVLRRRYDKEIYWYLRCAAVLAVTGKMVSDYAETKPSLKNVKNKLKKTGKDFTTDCKEVLDATKRVFTGELPIENTMSAEIC